MAIIVRVLLLAVLVMVVIYFLRLLARRLAADPRLRRIFSGVGLQMLRVALLRGGLLRVGLPLLLRAFRMLRFFR